MQRYKGVAVLKIYSGEIRIGLNLFCCITYILANGFQNVMRTNFELNVK